MDSFAGFGVVDDRADRNFEGDVHAFAPGLIRAFAVAAALSFVLGIETEMDERVVPFAGLHDDVATFAAIAPGRAAARHKLLAPEGNASVAAITGFHADCGFIDEQGKSPRGHRGTENCNRNPVYRDETNPGAIVAHC